jgi:hypothetical protein
VSGNALVRLETACANAVERTFAFVFPSALEPVVIARKLVQVFEAGSGPELRNGRRFIVRLHPSDFARFAGELPYLERQWSAMLARLCERSPRPQRPPSVASRADGSVAAGTVAIATETRGTPQRLALRVRKGLPAGEYPLDRDYSIGRDASCDIVLTDRRVSRRHLGVACAGDVRFTDFGSSNGTYLNGVRVSDGTIACGDVLSLGDCELVVDAEAAGGGER